MNTTSSSDLELGGQPQAGPWEGAGPGAWPRAGGAVAKGWSQRRRAKRACAQRGARTWNPGLSEEAPAGAAQGSAEGSRELDPSPGH